MSRITGATAYALAGGIYCMQLGSGCGEARMTPPGESASTAGTSAGPAGAGAANAGDGQQTAGAGGAAGAREQGPPPEALDGGVCMSPEELAYDTPGCDGSVVARCLFNDNPCASVACSCTGETILGGCGYVYEPFAYRGRCMSPDADASAP